MKAAAAKARVLGRASIYRRLIILAGQNLLWPGVFIIMLLAILVGAFAVQGQWGLPSATPPPPVPTVQVPVTPNAPVLGPPPAPASQTASPVNNPPAVASTVYGPNLRTCGP